MKRILSFILVLSMVLCLPCIGANADNTSYADEAIMHLQNIGVMERGIIPSEYMTRGEFAQIVANITGNREPVAGTFTFGDLGADHKNYDAIQHCVQRGYIGGNGGMVRPDDYITYIEAMTVMSRVLNYTDYAVNNGDYTRGYYTTAKMLGLLNGTNITSSDEPMSNSDAAKMIYNAMQCNINRLAEISPFYYTYVAIDKTLAYEMLSLNHVKGIMNSNGFTDISGRENYGDSLVVIGDYKLSSRYLDPSHKNLVGREVSAYYDDNYNIVSVVPTSKNTVITVTNTDFVDISGTTFKYLENDAEKKAKLEADALYFLNGKAVLDFDATDFEDAEYADIRIIDNNDDSAFDCVFVSVYDTFVVYSTDSDGVVSAYNDTKSVNLGEDNGKETIIYNANGKIISVEDIVPYSVLSVMETDKYVYAVNTEGYFTGKVSHIDEYYVTINDLESDVPNGTKGFFDKVSVGEYVNAYFDFDGRVVYVEKNYNLSNDQQFGYIVKCEFDSGFDKTIKLKLFTKHGEMVVLKTRNKFKINNTPYTAGKLTSLPSEFLKDGEIKNTVILYKTNANNEITEITFPTTYLADDEDGFIQTYESLKKSLYANGFYDLKVFVNSNTTFFNIPKDLDDEEAYKVLPFSKMPTSVHTVDVFHFSKNNEYADVIVATGDTNGLTYTTTLSVVTKVSAGIDEKGNEVIKLSHFYDNVPKVSIAKKPAVIEKVKTYKPGDAVRVAHLNDEIVDCERIYDYENEVFTKSSKAVTSTTGSLYMANGYVIFDNNKFFRLSDKNEKISSSDLLKVDGFLYGSAKIMLVEDTARGVDVKSGTLADVKVGSHVLLQVRGGATKYIVVYKDK